MTTPVQIPADVDREDRLLGELTARQLIILTTTGLAVYLVWTFTGPAALIAFGVATAPLGLAGLVLAFGRRDGVSADRLLWAALTQRRQTPSAPHPRTGQVAGMPAVDPPSAVDPRSAAVARRSRRPWSRTAGRAVAARVPARRVLAAGPDLGVIDLGRDGWAMVCAVTPVNLTLRSGAERDVLLAGFARWLHSLALPVQILTRTHPVDLTDAISGLRRDAARLPHPALRAAALAHAEHLHSLGSAAELLHREFLIVFRTPAASTPAASTPAAPTPAVSTPTALTGASTTPTRTRRTTAGLAGETAADRATRAAITQLRRRAEEAVGLLGGIGLRVTPLDPAQATRVLQTAIRPNLAATATATATPSPAQSRGCSVRDETRSPGISPPRPGGTRRRRCGVDEPTIELVLADPAAAVRRACGARVGAAVRSPVHRAINADLLRAAGGGRPVPASADPLDAAAHPSVGDDDAIERANTACAGGDPVEPSDALAIAATIAAALEPRRTALGVEEGLGSVDVAPAEDMALDGDEEPVPDRAVGDESRHTTEQPAGTSSMGSPARRGPRPIGSTVEKGRPSTRSTPARSSTRAGRGSATRPSGRRP